MVGALGGLVDLALVARGARAIVADAGHALRARHVYWRRRGPALRLELQEALERSQRFTRGRTSSSSLSSSLSSSPSPKKTAQALMPSSPATARLPSPSGEGLGMGHRQRRVAGPGPCGRVAIDGTAASGKSVIARAVAERYGVPHYNTGAAYRAFALLAHRAGLSPPPPSAPKATTTRTLAKAQAAFARADDALSADGAIVVDGRRLEYSFLISEVGETVAIWARHPAVRGAVDVVIAEALRKKSAVVEGRDVGSRLWPRAPTRLFLTASLQARAERVVERQGDKRLLRQVRVSLARRDHLDATRAVDAMGAAPGAVTIDTTTRSERDVIRAVLAIIAAAMGGAV